MRRRVSLAWLLLTFLVAASPASAQQAASAPLDRFIKEVAYLWSGSDVRALADLMPRETQVLLDTGRGIEAVDARHAAAALRSLFSDRESVSVRPMRVTLASSRPPRGFGELAWSFRGRTTSSSETRSVYVGAVWSDEGWRISELRLMP